MLLLLNDVDELLASVLEQPLAVGLELEELNELLEEELAGPHDDEPEAEGFDARHEGGSLLVDVRAAGERWGLLGEGLMSVERAYRHWSQGRNLIACIKLRKDAPLCAI
jgi:hypothetical protein